MELSKVYNPKKVEDKIYKFWLKSGFFNPDKLPGKRKKPFTIIMPPPNANGSLHIGHAVFVTLEDIMIRYHRMKGEKTLWLPGADHAGFETQVVFDKKLEKEGRSRFKIPREKLYQEILEFTLKNKKIMEGQLKKLGASCDWSREKFTLDKDIVKIVYQTFEKLKKDGLLYKGERVINWCTRHQTSLSDLEIKYEERRDPLYYIKYGPLELATVRLETKFGDTAIAVNPKDKRYKKYVGKEIEIETLLGSKKMKVIADEAVDMEFGTGAVKVTPAHDLVDFEIWQRHKSEIPPPLQVIDRFGRLNEYTGPYQGLKVMEARRKIAQDLAKRGLLNPAKTDHNYKHNVAVCYKCGSTIEPMILKDQWFIKMTTPPKTGKFSLRDLGVKAVKKGQIKFIPKRFEKIFFHWMKNLRDWNISRQIPWGIKIPAWHCRIKMPPDKKMGFDESIIPQIFKGKTSTWRLRDHSFKAGDVVAFENSQAGEIFGYGKITKVIKTTVGQINLKDKAHYKTYKNRGELIEALKRYNPDFKINENTPLFAYTYSFRKITAEDGGCGKVIISEKKPKKCSNCGSTELMSGPDVFDTWFSSGQWPFATLMTARKGDFKKFYPTDVMETAWDILFFWVARMIMLGIYITGKIPFRYVYLHGLVRDKERQKMSKSRGNVIDPLGVIDIYGTDALRMALVVGNTPGNDPIIYEEKIRGYRNFANKIWNASRFVLMNLTDYNPNFKPKLNKSDKKTLKDLDNLKKEISKLMESFRFYRAAEKLYHYFWHNFADKIIEGQKARLKSSKLEERNTSQYLLLEILATNLKLLHPFIPFITEEIYQKLPIYSPKFSKEKIRRVKKKKSLMIEKWPD